MTKGVGLGHTLLEYDYIPGTLISFVVIVSLQRAGIKKGRPLSSAMMRKPHEERGHCGGSLLVTSTNELRSVKKTTSGFSNYAI